MASRKSSVGHSKKSATPFVPIKLDRNDPDIVGIVSGFISGFVKLENGDGDAAHLPQTSPAAEDLETAAEYAGPSTKETPQPRKVETQSQQPDSPANPQSEDDQQEETQSETETQLTQPSPTYTSERKDVDLPDGHFYPPDSFILSLRRLLFHVQKSSTLKTISQNWNEEHHQIDKWKKKYGDVEMPDYMKEIDLEIWGSSIKVSCHLDSSGLGLGKLPVSENGNNKCSHHTLDCSISFLATEKHFSYPLLISVYCRSCSDMSLSGVIVSRWLFHYGAAESGPELKRRLYFRRLDFGLSAEKDYYREAVVLPLAFNERKWSIPESLVYKPFHPTSDQVSKNRISRALSVFRSSLEGSIEKLFLKMKLGKAPTEATRAE